MISFLPVTIIISTHPDLIGHAPLIKTAKRYGHGYHPIMTSIITAKDFCRNAKIFPENYKQEKQQRGLFVTALLAQI
jgi:hypothetical protein